MLHRTRLDGVMREQNLELCQGCPKTGLESSGVRRLLRAHVKSDTFSLQKEHHIVRQAFRSPVFSPFSFPTCSSMHSQLKQSKHEHIRAAHRFQQNKAAIDGS